MPNNPTHNLDLTTVLNAVTGIARAAESNAVALIEAAASIREVTEHIREQVTWPEAS